jgi:hypothetical protein
LQFYASGGVLRPFKWWPSPSVERRPMWHVPSLCLESTEHWGALKSLVLQGRT